MKILFKKEFDKKPVYDNKYISAKVNDTKFEYKILNDSKHCNKSIEPKNHMVIIRLNSYLSKQLLFK